MKSLVAFFSRAGSNYVGGKVANLAVGNTEVAAGLIRDLVRGELFRIETVRAYPRDYEETTRVAQEEMRRNARPELAHRVQDMKDFGVGFLGYPNWWGTMPMPVFSFLEEYDFRGKRLLPFCTHEGSGLGKSENDIRRLCPGAKVEKGLAIRGANVQSSGSAIAAWLRQLRLLD
jgi:flavodoxin